MRVLSVLPGVNPSAGAERSFAAVAPELVARGHDVHLAVLTERQGLVRELEEAGVVVHDLSPEGSLAHRVRSIREVVDATGPDVVHATLWDAVVPSQVVCALGRVPLVVTWAGVGYSGQHTGRVGSWKLRSVMQLDRVLARCSRCTFHAVTEGVAAANAALLGVPGERVRVVERGRADVIPPPPERLAALRGELGLPDGVPVVLAVGRHEPVKDHETLVRAVARSRSGAHLLVAGRDGSATAALERAVAETGTGERVHLLGQREDVEDLLALADLFVLSSRSEGAAGGVIEAFRASTPVVATDVAGQRGILVDGVNALVVPVADPEAMAAAVDRVLADPALARSLAEAGRRDFERRFTLERSVDGLEALYRDLAGRWSQQGRPAQKSSRSP